MLSDTLQSKELDLARAIDLVESVQKTLTECRCQEYFHNKIWLNAVKDASESNVDVDSTQRRHQSATPSCLEEALVLVPLGRRTHDSPTDQATNRVLYFSIVDKVLGELRRFDESREIILAVAACCPKSNHFLDAADECSIEMSNLEPQLAVAKNLNTCKPLKIFTYYSAQCKQPFLIFSLLCVLL